MHQYPAMNKLWRRLPAEHFDAGLQHERTALAWERTAGSMMVAGTILARFAAVDAHAVLAMIGLLQVGLGGAVLLWAGIHYHDLHGPLRADDPVVHPLAARVVGLSTIAFSAASLVLAVALVLGP